MRLLPTSSPFTPHRAHLPSRGSSVHSPVHSPRGQVAPAPTATLDGSQPSQPLGGVGRAFTVAPGPHSRAGHRQLSPVEGSSTGMARDPEQHVPPRASPKVTWKRRAACRGWDLTEPTERVTRSATAVGSASAGLGRQTGTPAFRRPYGFVPNLGHGFPGIEKLLLLMPKITHPLCLQVLRTNPSSLSWPSRP